MVAVLAVGAFGIFVYRQVSPPLPPSLASLGAVSVRDGAGTPQPLGAHLQPSAMTIVSFWATYCLPCRKEAKVLAQLVKTHSSKQLNVVYLNVDDGPDTAAVEHFLAAADATGLPLIFAGKTGWRAITGSGTVTLPRSYIFDRLGRPVTALTGFGPTSAHDLAAMVERAAKLGG